MTQAKHTPGKMNYKPGNGYWDKGTFRQIIWQEIDGGLYPTGYWLNATGSSNLDHSFIECALLFANRHGIRNAANFFPKIIKENEKKEAA